MPEPEAASCPTEHTIIAPRPIFMVVILSRRAEVFEKLRRNSGSRWPRRTRQALSWRLEKDAKIRKRKLNQDEQSSL
jgi:hypothetical protein